MSLPSEVIYLVAQHIIDTPAVFVFDIDIAARPHPPLIPQGVHMRFRPVVHPPIGQHEYGSYPGTYESQISKTIRALLLTNKLLKAECLKYLKGINVPTVSQHAIVRFNPRKHVICIRQVRFSDHQYVSSEDGSTTYTSWIKHDADLLTNINFEIHHIAFTGHPPSRENCAGKWNLEVLRMTFPTIQHIYVVVAESPRRNPSLPLDLVCPAFDTQHILSPVFLHMAKPHWRAINRLLAVEPLDHTGIPFREYLRMAHAQDIAYEELVLI